MPALITLLSDFGAADTFVGVMKGVIKSIHPTADIVDLTHGIEPQNVILGAIAWQAAVPYFPPGTIHVGVVDPGVGTSRLHIAVQAGDATFICPDNGLLTFIARERTISRIVSIENPAYRLTRTSRTFHGRDILAPAAAHLAAGVDIDELGRPLDDFVLLAPTEPAIRRDFIIAHIVYFDTFGNAYSDLTESRFVEWGTARFNFTVNGTAVNHLVEAYADVERGSPLAIFGSHGRLEIAVRNSSARTSLNLSVGDEVRFDRID
jgi:S-adenosylmethionine hydrolase